MDWFSGWHWAIVAVVFLVLFGSSRLPGAAKSLGSSMNIFKRSLKEGASDDGQSVGPSSLTQGTALPSPGLVRPPSDVARQVQIDDLQRQIQDLQRAPANGDARSASGEPSHGAQS